MSFGVGSSMNKRCAPAAGKTSFALFLPKNSRELVARLAARLPGKQ